MRRSLAIYACMMGRRASLVCLLVAVLHFQYGVCKVVPNGNNPPRMNGLLVDKSQNDPELSRDRRDSDDDLKRGLVFASPLKNVQAHEVYERAVDTIAQAVESSIRKRAVHDAAALALKEAADIQLVLDEEEDNAGPLLRRVRRRAKRKSRKNNRKNNRRKKGRKKKKKKTTKKKRNQKRKGKKSSKKKSKKNRKKSTKKKASRKKSKKKSPKKGSLKKSSKTISAPVVQPRFHGLKGFRPKFIACLLEGLVDDDGNGTLAELIMRHSMMSMPKMDDTMAPTMNTTMAPTMNTTMNMTMTNSTESRISLDALRKLISMSNMTYGSNDSRPIRSSMKYSKKIPYWFTKKLDIPKEGKLQHQLFLHHIFSWFNEEGDDDVDDLLKFMQQKSQDVSSISTNMALMGLKEKKDDKMFEKCPDLISEFLGEIDETVAVDLYDSLQRGLTALYAGDFKTLLHAFFDESDKSLEILYYMKRMSEENECMSSSLLLSCVFESLLDEEFAEDIFMYLGPYLSMYRMYSNGTNETKGNMSMMGKNISVSEEMEEWMYDAMSSNYSGMYSSNITDSDFCDMERMGPKMMLKYMMNESMMNQSATLEMLMNLSMMNETDMQNTMMNMSAYNPFMKMIKKMMMMKKKMMMDKDKEMMKEGKKCRPMNKMMKIMMNHSMMMTNMSGNPMTAMIGVMKKMMMDDSMMMNSSGMNNMTEDSMYIKMGMMMKMMKMIDDPTDDMMMNPSMSGSMKKNPFIYHSLFHHLTEDFKQHLLKLVHKFIRYAIHFAEESDVDMMISHFMEAAIHNMSLDDMLEEMTDYSMPRMMMMMNGTDESMMNSTMNGTYEGMMNSTMNDNSTMLHDYLERIDILDKVCPSIVMDYLPKMKFRNVMRLVRKLMWASKFLLCGDMDGWMMAMMMNEGPMKSMMMDNGSMDIMKVW